VIERAVDLLLAELERKRLAKTKRPRRKPAAGTQSRNRVTNSTRRKVYERDGLQCTYQSSDGRRCQARAFLELDHTEPRALGGSSTLENLRVLCRSHNQLAAEQTFGRETIDRHKYLRQRKWVGESTARNGQQPTKRESNDSTLPTPNVLEKVRLALTSMGFRDARARRAAQ
jgi:5-methylcytosine-specific restriction endonuclease McrA